MADKSKKGIAYWYRHETKKIIKTKIDTLNQIQLDDVLNFIKSLK